METLNESRQPDGELVRHSVSRRWTKTRD